MELEGERVEAVTDFIFLGSKITVDSDGRQEMKRHLLLGRKAMTNLDSVLKSREELKSLLMKVKEESENAGLKPNIQKEILSSSHFTSWHIDEETMETVRAFIFLGYKITADGDCSHDIKRHLLLGRNVMMNLESILKIRDVTLPRKVHQVKAMVFPVVMYGCEN